MIFFKSLPSTNDYLKRNYKTLDNFDSVLVDEQLEGRGRGDHTWVSEPNKNATFSILVKDSKIIKNYNMVSIHVGLAIANYLTNFGIENVKIKWPNDIMVNDNKICGILLEGNISNYLIIGVGINVNQTKFEGFSATSIKNEIGIKIDKNLVATDLNDLIVDTLKTLPEDLENSIDEYDHFDYLLNKTISFEYNGDKLNGTAKGINLDGTYKILVNDKIIEINSNEISLVRKY